MTIEIVRVGPLVTVQARPRRGHARHGVPGSGPLDEAAFLAALAAVGAAEDAAALEIPLMGAVFRAGRDLRASIDGAPPRVVRTGEAFEVTRHERAVRYLAIDGGIAVPRVLGSAATLVTAGIGGHQGRALVQGDVLPLGRGAALPLGSPAGATQAPPPLPIVDEIPFEPIPGVSVPATRFTIDPRSDRVGTRLTGHLRWPGGGECEPAPLVPGALQLPPDGHPIVIGPDGPTTGGYRVVGVLSRAARDLLARLRPGATVTLRPGR